MVILTLMGGDTGFGLAGKVAGEFQAIMMVILRLVLSELGNGDLGFDDGADAGECFLFL